MPLFKRDDILHTDIEPAKYWDKIMQDALNSAPVYLRLEKHLQKGEGDQVK